ncbi:hypothetical protein ACIRP0_10840 [Streptomyces sp. NPDC101733]|uniref:hypothetical protein n=1 Tax=unclassified Streptomyces TaxID=2593676 RepID=UPI003825CCFE
MTADTSLPPVWFRLPAGFHDLSPHDRESLDVVAEALGSISGRQELSELMDNVDRFTDRHVAYTSIGLHPDGAVGVATSVFALTLRPAEHPNPRVSVARTTLAITRSRLWTESSGRVLDLPSTLPCSMVTGAISLPGVGQRLFQGRIVMAHPSGTHVVLLDLTSAAIRYTDAYTDIIEAVAHTVAFSDPEPSPHTDPKQPSRVMEVLL